MEYQQKLVKLTIIYILGIDGSQLLSFFKCQQEPVVRNRKNKMAGAIAVPVR